MICLPGLTKKNVVFSCENTIFTINPIYNHANNAIAKLLFFIDMMYIPAL